MISWCRTPGTASTMRWVPLPCLSDFASYERIGLATLLGLCAEYLDMELCDSGVSNVIAGSLCPGCSHVMQVRKGHTRNHTCCMDSHSASLDETLP